MLKYLMTSVLFFVVLPLSFAASEDDTVPVSPAISAESSIPAYRLGFGDVVEIKFFENERFNETVTIRPDGRISLERMGEIFVTGMTPLELDSLITLKYGEFIQEPDVTVIVRDFSGNQVYVLGEVNSPGGFPVERKMTLLQAIASAGGPKEGAKLGSVILLRQEADGESGARKVDLEEAIRNGDPNLRENDLYVLPRDILYVPKTNIANVSTFMQQIYDGFLPPVDLYLRWLWWTKWN